MNYTQKMWDLITDYLSRGNFTISVVAEKPTKEEKQAAKVMKKLIQYHYKQLKKRSIKSKS